MRITFKTSLATLTMDGGCFAKLAESIAAAWREGGKLIPRMGLEVVAAKCHDRRFWVSPDGPVVFRPDVEFETAAVNPQNANQWIQV